MNKNFYSNTEFTALKERINQEILRRGTFKWNAPLTTPSVGQDRSSPLSVPDIGKRVEIDDKTYTINNPSTGSIEPTRNRYYPAQGENPAGENPNKKKNVPNSSAGQVNVDEMKNYLVGLSVIHDINLFYGRDEVRLTAFRDPNGIEEVTKMAEDSVLNAPLAESDIPAERNDPNGGWKTQKSPDYPEEDCPVIYPQDENGVYYMPSGEYDGEQVKEYEGLGPHNFYDDYGAKSGDGNFHPYNRYTSELVRRDWNDQGNYRNDKPKIITQGGEKSIRFGTNPRNPEMGEEFISRPVYGGKEGACNISCSGLCYMTCDNECSESCQNTCWNRCGNACTSDCGNVCTGCSTLCFNTCKTKCENTNGYACVNSGAVAVNLYSIGGKEGVPAQNHIEHTTYSCQGCSFSCQFYPNKKTECWDAGCMGKCFITCNSGCATSCFGGCIDNQKEELTEYNSRYKTGKGRGCSSGCTINCVGICSGVCEGYCVHTCYMACKTKCHDNCSWICSTQCGRGCTVGCTVGCTGCSSCTGSCKDVAMQRTCVGCGATGGCKTDCMWDCNKHCMGWGCRNICGIESTGACENNCRLNCLAHSCTSKCSQACSDLCTTCVNNCGMLCGACSSECSTGCTQECNVYCTQSCSNNCDDNCVHSCTEECGGCSNLCYSCIGMCIGVCSVTCEDRCTSCANQCGWWCDIACSRGCMQNCSDRCLNTCSGSCATYLMSETTYTEGPERDPIAEGYIYPHPKNRWEERESFKLIRDIPPMHYEAMDKVYDKLITIAMIPNKYFKIFEMHLGQIFQRIQRIREVRDDTLITNIMTINRSDILKKWTYDNGAYKELLDRRIYKGDFIYLWDIDTRGDFDPVSEYWTRDRNFLVLSPNDLQYVTIQTSVDGGVYNIDEETGEITINEDMLPGPIDNSQCNYETGGGLFLVKFFNHTIREYEPDPGQIVDTTSPYHQYDIKDEDIEIIIPFGFEHIGNVVDSEGNLIVIIQRDKFLLPEEKAALEDMKKENNNGEDN